MRMLFAWVMLAGVMLAASAGLADEPATLRVGCDTSFMPFEFKQDGRYVGFDIDLWDAVARDLGVRYELQPMDFNGLIPGLQSGNIDVALAGMTVKSEREKVVDFAYPYYSAGLMLLVRADEKAIASMADLKGKTVATKLGTTSHDFAKSRTAAGKVSLFPNIDGAYMELITGGADAVIFDSPALLYYANGTGKGRVKVVGPRYMGQSYGMAFPAGSPWREKVTISLLKLMENGAYAEIYKKWFGVAPE